MGFLCSLVSIISFTAFAQTTMPNENLIPDPNNARQYVEWRLNQEGIIAPWLDEMLTCESGWSTQAIGDAGNSYGLWQINLPSHPIGQECAEDVACSTEYAIQLIKSERSWSHWTCFKGL